jgi:hypothetical protein
LRESITGEAGSSCGCQAEPAIGFPASFSDFHDFAYAYTVGS